MTEPTGSPWPEVGQRTRSGGASGSASRPAALVFAGILLSRIVGLVRERVFGFYFGVTAEADAFRAVGGFSTALFAGEELEFSKRLKKHARAKRKKMRIISDQRLLTSARKMHLYTGREHLRFMLRALFFPKQVLGNPAECHTWYDGRR